MESLSRSGRILPGLFILGVLLLLAVLTAGCTQQTATPAVTTPAPLTTPGSPGIANPASVYCRQVGGTTDIKKDASGGEYGMCTFTNGTSCEEWALFRSEGCKAGVVGASQPAYSGMEIPLSGIASQPDKTNPGSGISTPPAPVGMANPASVYCRQVGGTTDIKKDASGGEYGMCTFNNGTSCEEWALFRGEGCKAGVPETGGKKMVTFTEADNGKTSDIAQGTRFAVQLKENPTTGFQWNVTYSNGLSLVSDDYQVNPHAEGMVGVGGLHTWIFLAKDTGVQKIAAVYRRSWEPVTGNETAVVVNVNVVKI
jgi:putative hemolysin/predicted secreted protein